MSRSPPFPPIASSPPRPGPGEAEGSGRGSHSSESPTPDASPEKWSEDEREAFRRALLGFFDEARRPLPWRANRDPYRILVSEFMLQQTRVDTVVPYFERWVERFPDAEALAAADQEEVLQLWQGLGYYSRARNLHRAVREVVADYGGTFPSEPALLRTLPGVGGYTAGAVASIAFGVVAAAVDGNVRRVMARLADAPSPTPGELQRWVTPLVDVERPGDFNQGLMELGALVCTPREPDCPACPVARFCAARSAGTEEDRPAPRARRDVPELDEGVAVLLREGRLLFERRPDTGLLGGMWGFPGATTGEGETPQEAALRRAVGLGAAANGFSEVRALAAVDHVFSHRKVRYHPFLIELHTDGFSSPESGFSTPEKGVEPVRWLAVPEGIEDLPLPAAQRRIVGLVAADLAGSTPTLPPTELRGV